MLETFNEEDKYNSFQTKESKKGKRNRRREEKAQLDEQLEIIKELELEDEETKKRNPNQFISKFTEEQQTRFWNIQEMFYPLIDSRVVSLVFEENEFDEQKTVMVLEEMASALEVENAIKRIEREERGENDPHVFLGHINEEQITFLKIIFPDFTEEFLKSELTTNDMNIEKTVEILLPLTMFVGKCTIYRNNLTGLLYLLDKTQLEQTTATEKVDSTSALKPVGDIAL
jgi:hypothetical protein